MHLCEGVLRLALILCQNNGGNAHRRKLIHGSSLRGNRQIRIGQGIAHALDIRYHLDLAGFIIRELMYMVIISGAKYEPEADVREIRMHFLRQIVRAIGKIRRITAAE